MWLADDDDLRRGLETYRQLLLESMGSDAARTCATHWPLDDFAYFGLSSTFGHCADELSDDAAKQDEIRATLQADADKIIAAIFVTEVLEHLTEVAEHKVTEIADSIRECIEDGRYSLTALKFYLNRG